MTTLLCNALRQPRTGPSRSPVSMYPSRGNLWSLLTVECVIFVHTEVVAARAYQSWPIQRVICPKIIPWTVSNFPSFCRFSIFDMVATNLELYMKPFISSPASYILSYSCHSVLVHLSIPAAPFFMNSKLPFFSYGWLIPGGGALNPSNIPR